MTLKINIEPMSSHHAMRCTSCDCPADLLSCSFMLLTPIHDLAFWASCHCDSMR